MQANATASSHPKQVIRQSRHAGSFAKVFDGRKQPIRGLWIVGDPSLRQVYGWAAWLPRLGILTLRNPTDKPATFTADLQALFELPPGSAEAFQLKSPWKNRVASPTLEISAHQSHMFNLRPFEVLIPEARAVPGGERISTSALRAAATTKISALQ